MQSFMSENKRLYISHIIFLKRGGRGTNQQIIIFRKMDENAQTHDNTCTLLYVYMYRSMERKKNKPTISTTPMESFSCKFARELLTSFH